MLETSGESFGMPTPVGRAAAQLRQTLGDALSGDVHIDAVRKCDRHDGQAGNGLRAHRRQARRAIDGVLDRFGDEFLHLLRGESRRLGLDVDLRGHEFGEDIQRRTAAHPSSPGPAPARSSAVTAPKWRTHSLTSARIELQSASVLGFDSRAKSNPGRPT